MLCFPQKKKLAYSTIFSEIYHSLDPVSKETSVLVVLKLPNITANLKNHLNQEILYLNSHKNQGLVQFHNCQILNEGCSLILETPTDELLTAFISKNGIFTESNALSHLSAIIKVYDLYKSENMPLRDFSIDNIWINQGHVKIFDLGLFYNPELAKINQNELNFCKSPEIFFEGKYIPDVSEVWSLGVILFYMFFGNLPWRGKTESGFFQAIKEIPLKIPSEKQHLSPKAITLLTQALSIDTKKRINWQDLKNHELFKTFKDPSVFSPSSKQTPEDCKEKKEDSNEKKWKFNIVSFYCKNDFILQNSFLEKEAKKKTPINYPSLDENVKSISECENVANRISVNRNQTINKEDRSRNEEKRIVEIDNLIQKLIDTEKMNFSLSLKQNSCFQDKKQNQNVLATGESVFKPKLVQSTFQKQDPKANLASEMKTKKLEENKTNEKISVFQEKNSIFLGKSQLKSETKGKEDIQLVFSKNINEIMKQVEKYNVLGKSIGDSELVFRKILDLELWSIQRFLLMKKLIKFRLALTESLQQGENLLNLPIWSEFLKSEPFLSLLSKLKKENAYLKEDFEKLYRKTTKSLKKFQLDETNKIQKFLNLDLSQNFDSLFFICLYLHIKTIASKVEAALKFNNMDKAMKMLMHKAEMIDCVIINELDFMTDIPDYFDLTDFERAINSFDVNTLKSYVERKEKVLEIWKPKYIS